MKRQGFAATLGMVAILTLDVPAPFPASAAAGAQAPAAADEAAARRRITSRLDNYPASVMARMQRIRNRQLDRRAVPAGRGRARSAVRTSAIFLPDTRWNKRTVTVAFRGGNESVYALIESTAQEWTANGRGLAFSFRDRRGRFRTWQTTDTEAAADIRIGFEEGDENGGYWSLLGRLAQGEEPNVATMNYEGFVADLEPFGEGGPEWRASFFHHTILHEFGHALGLVHEHFHPRCQEDLRLDPDEGYEPTFHAETGEYVPDGQGRSPGAILYYQGPPNGWKPAQATFNVRASNYWMFTLMDVADYFKLDSVTVDTPAEIDNRSVMLYWFRDYLFAGGDQSACRNLGDGRFGDDVFATTLSARDIAQYRRYYR